MFPILANASSSKPVGVESLFGPLGELLNAMLNAVKWMHRGEGFLACLTLVVLVMVFAMVFGAVFGYVIRRDQ